MGQQYNKVIKRRRRTEYLKRRRDREKANQAVAKKNPSAKAAPESDADAAAKKAAAAVAKKAPAAKKAPVAKKTPVAKKAPTKKAATAQEEEIEAVDTASIEPAVIEETSEPGTAPESEEA